MNILLDVKCFSCNKVTENSNEIIIRKTGTKLFRICTSCNDCGRCKSKMFCDRFEMLPKEMYQLEYNKMYIDYLPNGTKFTEIDRNIYPYIRLRTSKQELTYY